MSHCFGPILGLSYDMVLMVFKGFSIILRFVLMLITLLVSSEVGDLTQGAKKKFFFYENPGKSGKIPSPCRSHLKIAPENPGILKIHIFYEKSI